MFEKLRKLLVIAGVLLLGNVWADAQENLSALLPLPNRIRTIETPGDFFLSSRTSIYINSVSLTFEASELQRILQTRTGLSPEIVPVREQASILLCVDSSLTGREHYVLDVSSRKLTITGSTSEAVFRGLMTLDQILLGDVCRTVRRQIAPVYIEDEPRFAYRALMLDPARHFLPVKDVKFFIDQMARYKYNVLQLHLTDDQGWRIEIKKYPALTRIGARRNPETGSQGPDNGFYTQDQLKELVRYAADRHIEIIPELDIPGHTVAVLSAYPGLGCTPADTLPKVMGKTENLMLCAAHEKVYTLYRDILAEVASLFPSEWIHLGGDEAAVSQNWLKCDRCRALMKKRNYTEAGELMNYFFGKILPDVRKNGKKAILWCELDRIAPPAHDYLFPYPSDVTLVSWRYGLTPLCLDLTAKSGNKLIMAPGEYAYLDYPQWKGDLPEFNNWGMPLTSLETCYRFDPGYGKPLAEQTHILGITGTLWGEAMKDINRVTYMAYPRALALAEAGWTRMEFRDWDSFKVRLYPNLFNLIKQGVSVRVPFEIVSRP